MAKGYSMAQSWAALIGRILISLIFIISGIHKITGFDATVSTLAQTGLPSPQWLSILSIIFELGGGILLFFGLFTRFGAFLLLVFVLLVTFVFHRFWVHEPSDMLNQMHHFMKNFSIIGALLYIMAFGAGRLSFDSGRYRRAE
ncbi:DoxX family protein [Coxiella burnetii]|uniref:DoxX family protein n=1 Tax=Coxiella burnetii TaxID=777 RepID=UPI0000DAEC0E|nr:DoxX family protein [Coxiella burnetii]ATN81899.1 DoxX family protein [Coxiella burnetii]ATN83801.1 DoxX family protein [Coxiella burnetii]